MLQNRKQLFEINFDKMRQRGFLLLAAVVLFTSCNSLKGTKTGSRAFAKGADIGWLQQMEATGYKFYGDDST